MLSARAIASLSDDMTALYSELEFEIKKQMIKRLNKLLRVTETTRYEAFIVQEVGALKKDIYKIIDKYEPEIQKELESLFNKAMDEARAGDVKYYKFVKRELSDSQKQKLNTTINRLYNAEVINKTYAAQQARLEKVFNSITRLTLTVADASEKEFLRVCNNAYMKVNSGAFSWGSAYKTALNEQAKAAYNEQWKAAIKEGALDIADNGVKTILYDYSGRTRRISLESATRMNIITGINQSASEQTLENAAEIGSDLVEVSAHIGARNVDRDGRPWANHEDIQGKVYCINGERDYIDGNGETRHAPNFYEVCGLGEPDGICGINCRHSFYPYIEGLPLEYSDSELDEYKEKRVELDGHKISPYEAGQELRNVERGIRQNKARAQALELTDNTDDPKYIKAKENIYILQEKARHITDETGIERKYINEYIGTVNGEQPRGIKPRK